METTEKKETKSSPSIIEGMFEAGAHLGYSKSRRHPSFKNIIFGSKSGVDIINLEKTSSFLVRVIDFLKEAVGEGKMVLFVGTKPEVRRTVQETAEALEVPYVTNRWVGGMLTNFAEMQKRMARLDDLEKRKEKGELDVYTKKERMEIDEEIADLTTKFGGVRAIGKLPEVIIVIDPRHEDIAIREAARKGVTVVALASSDCDITGIEYPIPANDSSVSSAAFFIEKIADAIREGKRNAEAKKEEEKETKSTAEKSEQSK